MSLSLIRSDVIEKILVLNVLADKYRVHFLRVTSPGKSVREHS